MLVRTVVREFGGRPRTALNGGGRAMARDGDAFAHGLRDLALPAARVGAGSGMEMTATSNEAVPSKR